MEEHSLTQSSKLYQEEITEGTNTRN